MNLEFLVKNIKEILLKEWDPIGITALEEANDEYDGYVLDLCAMIRSKLGEREIASYLNAAEENMGLTSDHESNLNIAKTIISFTNK